MKNICVFLGMFLTAVIANILFMGSVDAAKIDVSPSTKKVVVGATVKVTVTLTPTSGQSLGAWEFEVKYDTNKLTLTSSTLESSTRSVGYGNKNTKSKTYTLTFKAKASGTANISIVNSNILDYTTDKPMSITNGSTSISVVTQADINNAMSSNRDLKSLTVVGYELTPVFNAKTLEYTLELENDVTSIKVNAEVADKKAKVTGTGTHEVKEGDNKIEVAVTAENGNRQVYIINVVVKELDPIIVVIDEEEFTVVRKMEGLEIPTTYEETTTIIQEQQVPAFISEISGFQLVALRDSSGNIRFFIDQGMGKYLEYIELRIGNLLLFVIQPEDGTVKENYKIGTGTIGGQTVTMYLSIYGKYPLLYALNIETGVKNWYSYDKVENTAQIYQEAGTGIKNPPDNKELLTYVLGGVSFLAIFSLIVTNILRRKKEG